MPNWSGSILTKKGLQLHAKAEAGATLNLTKIKLGSGLLATGQDVQDLTDLIQPEQEIGIAEKTVGEDGTCTIRGIITNQNVSKGYLIRECGIFADDPDEGEILYAIATDPNPDYLPPQGGATALSQEFAIPIIASNVANITAKIDLNSLATIAYVLNILKSIFGISEDITATTIKNKIVSYTNEVVTNLFGIATATTDSIKIKIKEWAMEKIEEWLETLEIRYNIAQNGYICLGKLFGYVIIQWGLIDTTTAGIFKKLLPISFTKQAFQAVASWDNPAELIDWNTIPSFIFAIRSDLDNIVVARNNKSSENKSFRYLAIGK